jgi:RNA polymerase sigma factor (sigma-70 family)
MGGERVRVEGAALGRPQGSRGAGAARSRLEELYLRHAPDAVRVAYLLTGDAALAQDLGQEAFVRVAARLVHLRNPDSFGAYLRQTVVNLVRMHARRRRAERAALQRAAALPVEPPVLPDVAGRDSLRGALLRLPVRQRAAIVLRFYEDLSERDAAGVLRCRPGTVASLVSRGMATLRRYVKEEDDEA